MKSTDTDVAVLPRGVYRARYRVEGRSVFVVIRANGDRLKQVIAPPGVSEPRLIEWLWDQLDRADPVEQPRPALRLVTPSPKPKTLTLEQLDALYRDADPIRRLLWQRKKEEMARKGLRIS